MSLNHLLGLFTKRVAKHYFVVDRLEDLVDEGGSRSSWRAHEHESFQLVSQQNVAIQIFWSTGLPVLSWFASSSKIEFLLWREKRVSMSWERGRSFWANNGFHRSIIMIWVWIWLVWLGTFRMLNNFVHLVVEQLLNPILSSSHVSRKSLEEAEGRIYFFVYDFSSFHPNNFRDTIRWECSLKDDYRVW